MPGPILVREEDGSIQGPARAEVDLRRYLCGEKRSSLGGGPDGGPTPTLAAANWRWVTPRVTVCPGLEIRRWAPSAAPAAGRPGTIRISAPLCQVPLAPAAPGTVATVP